MMTEGKGLAKNGSAGTTSQFREKDVRGMHAGRTTP